METFHRFKEDYALILSSLFSLKVSLGDGSQVFLCIMYNVVAFNQGSFAPRGDIWQILEVFLVVTTGRPLLASSGWNPGIPLNTVQ